MLIFATNIDYFFNIAEQIYLFLRQKNFYLHILQIPFCLKRQNFIFKIYFWNFIFQDIYSSRQNFIFMNICLPVIETRNVRTFFERVLRFKVLK